MHKNPPKIFLGDLIHNQHGYNYCVPLNLGYLAATLQQRFGNEVEVRLFKFPNELIASLGEKPDIIALSNYDWNVNLNKALIMMAKRQNPDVFVVMGGPNIRCSPEGIQEFLKQKSYIDVYVLYEGEDAFAGIVEHLLGHDGYLRDTLIKKRIELPQVAYLADDGALIKGSLCPSIHMKLIPHPSAWLSGYLDPYLNCRSFTLYPIIETTRGCPYQCTFCTAWGAAGSGVRTVRQFGLDTVFAELEYIFKKAEQSFYLMFADANIGILERDLKIAGKIRELADRYGKLTAVGFDTSKNNIQRNIEIYDILGDLGMPIFAQQTFNEDILTNVKRKNAGPEKTKMLVDYVHGKGFKICTDLLVGLPGESKKAHLDSLRMAMDIGFDRYQIGDIRLLLGTEMEEDLSRGKYGLKTKSRIIPNAYGIYGGEKVVEYENCIRETKAMSEKEFMELRLFHCYVFLLHTLDLGCPLLDLAKNHGLHQVDLIANVSEAPPKNSFPLLAEQYLDYMDHSCSEWFDTPEEANAYYLQDDIFEKLQREGFPKLNYDYASKLIMNPALVKELLNWVGYNIKLHLSQVDSLLVDEIVSFAIKRIINFPANDDSVKIMGVSGVALNLLAKYVAGYIPDNSQVTQKHSVEFVLGKKQKEKIENLVKNVTTSRGDRHAIELVLQFHPKLFLREVRLRLPQ